MAAAIDASSPAGVTATSTAAVTTASFTPPANAIIIAIASTGNSSGSGAQSGSISDSLTGAWTSVIAANTTGQGTAQIFRRDVGGSPAAMTVTWTPSGTAGKGSQLQVYVITGAGNASSAAIGATGSATTATTGALSITPTAVGSLLLMGLTYTNSGVTLTANGASTSDKATSDATNGETYAAAHLTATTASLTAVSVGYTSTGLGSVVQQVGVEIIAASGGGGGGGASGVVVVAQRMPTRLHVIVESGTTTRRWGIDEHRPENVPSALTFSSTMPGGFEQAALTLPRKPDVDYPDLDEFSKVTIRGAGGKIAWQGRLETTPRTSGDQLAISPGLTGYQAALADNNAAREIYIDCDLTRWQAASAQRQIALEAATYMVTSPTVVPDATTGQPSLAETNTGAWSGFADCEALYDAGGIPLAALYYAWKRGANTSNTDPTWTWLPLLSDDDLQTASDAPANLRAAGPGTGTLNATTATRKYAIVEFYYNAAGGTSGADYTLYWTYLGVVGRHGLTIRGTLAANGGIGVYASDVVAHAVAKYAPGLALVDRGGNSTIEATSFLIPQLVFTDATTAAAIVTQATSYGLEDWWVDEGPTFHLASRDNHGKDWQARVGPSGLQETGPTVDQIYNGAIVAYTDVSGITRTVGPPGSGANVEDARLFDSDPQNAATAAGLTRIAPPIQLGVSATDPTSHLPEGPIKVGQSFLIFQKQRSTAGQASLVGYVTDSTGVTWPAWMVRAGDRITFVDAHDPVPRRVVRSSYDDATRTNQIDLDSPPQGLAPMLARLSADQVQGLA